MRILIFLIVISAFLLWFGINFRQTRGKYAWWSLIIGALLAILVLLGFLRVI